MASIGSSWFLSPQFPLRGILSAPFAAEVAVIALVLLVVSAADPLPPGAVLRLGDPRFRAAGEVRHLRFSSDGAVLAGWAVGSHGELRPVLWDAVTGFPTTGHFDRSPPDSAEATNPAVRLGGNRVLTAGPGSAGRVWDATTERQLARLTGHAAAVTSVAVSADGKRLATGSADGLVRVWDAESFRPLSNPRGHTSALRTIRMSADGKRAITTADDGTARVWDLARGKELRALSTAGPVELTADGLGVILPAGGVLIRDVLTGLEVIPDRRPALPEPTVSELLARLGLCMAVSPDRRTAAVARPDGTLVLIEAATGQRWRELPGHGTSCRVLAFTLDGSRLLTGGVDHSVLVWDVRVQALPLPESVKQETRAAKHWATLTTGSAEAAYRAMARFAIEPAAAVRMARMRMKPTATAENDAVGWLADKRAVELLEALGTSEAREFLTELAGGVPDAWLTQEAKRALARQRER